MAKAKQKPQDPQPSNDPQLENHKIYLKNFSLEVPNAMSTLGEKWQPNLNLEIKANSKALGEQDTFEVVLGVKVTVTSNELQAFIIEVEQAGIFTVKNMEKEQKDNTLAIYCPNLLYPYLREVVSDQIMKAGFPQLNLAPINFEALHAEQNKETAETKS